MATLGNTTVLSLNVLNNITTSGTIYENGTALSSKYAAASHNHDSAYLGKTATAANSSKLNNQDASYYATAAAVTTNGNHIATNQTNIATNATNIGTNRSNITKIVNGDTSVGKARADGNGNTIIDTYATKTEATTASKKTSSANSTSKLFLIGATSQSSEASTTYSNSNCYISNSYLYSNGKKVLTSYAYRPIQVNGSSLLTSGDLATLNFKAGTNISLSGSGGTVTISSTASGGGSSGALKFECLSEEDYLTAGASVSSARIYDFDSGYNEYLLNITVGAETYMKIGNITKPIRGDAHVRVNNTNGHGYYFYVYIEGSVYVTTQNLPEIAFYDDGSASAEIWIALFGR